MGNAGENNMLYKRHEDLTLEDYRMLCKYHEQRYYAHLETAQEHGNLAKAYAKDSLTRFGVALDLDSTLSALRTEESPKSE